MSTEINLEELYNNSVKILSDLIGFRTISGEDNSALINYCEDFLHKHGATSFKTFDNQVFYVTIVRSPFELRNNAFHYHAKIFNINNSKFKNHFLNTVF